jgi:hypothetical protein
VKVSIGPPEVVLARDHRLVDVAGQVAADPRHRVAHVVDGAVDVLAELELDRGRRVAVGDDRR